MPASTPDARCPRCGASFHCGAAGGTCDCFELQLSDALRADLAQRYPGCLCLACLRALSRGSAPADGPGNAPG